jgi:hypothetical protein
MRACAPIENRPQGKETNAGRDQRIIICRDTTHVRAAQRDVHGFGKGGACKLDVELHKVLIPFD